MARPPKHPVDVKLKIVLSVLSGESTQAEASRRHGVAETCSNWAPTIAVGANLDTLTQLAFDIPLASPRGWA